MHIYQLSTERSCGSEVWGSRFDSDGLSETHHKTKTTTDESRVPCSMVCLAAFIWFLYNPCRQELGTNQLAFPQCLPTSQLASQPASLSFCGSMGHIVFLCELVVFIAVYSLSYSSSFESPVRSSDLNMTRVHSCMVVGLYFVFFRPCCCGKIIIFHLCHHPSINTFRKAKEFNSTNYAPSLSLMAPTPRFQPVCHFLHSMPVHSQLCYSSDEDDEKVDKHKPYFAKELKTYPSPPLLSPKNILSWTTCTAFDAIKQKATTATQNEQKKL